MCIIYVHCTTIFNDRNQFSNVTEKCIFHLPIYKMIVPNRVFAFRVSIYWRTSGGLQ